MLVGKLHMIAWFRWAWNQRKQISGVVISTRKRDATSLLRCAIRQSTNYVISIKAGGAWVAVSQRIASSKYRTNQLVYAVGYFFFSIAKSEWWGGDKKKLENWNLTCLVIATNELASYSYKYKYKYKLQDIYIYFTFNLHHFWYQL